MLLRASGVQVGVVVDPSRAEESGLPHAETFLAFADAVINRDEGALPALRDTLRSVVGAEGVVDAAGVVGNFERMNRIADGAGLELDAPVRVLAANIQDEMQLDTFASAAHSRKAGPVSKVIARMVVPIIARLFAKRSVAERP